MRLVQKIRADGSHLSENTNEKEKPRVWSIGTSFNSLGKSHHIIQEVQHPQMIVDAFEELWEELSYETCLIWRKD